MYLWYQRSSICYVFLSDVPSGSFWSSRWFTRGWTLQETIAPEYLEFYDENWKILGTKQSLRRGISEITGIPPEILAGLQSPDSCTVAQKMSWAAQRKTSKPEDIAYCLMGIFHVSMPMLYGEGEYDAFYRLQRGIMEISEDHTLFTWRRCDRVEPAQGLLANTPQAFAKTSEYDPSKLVPIPPAGGFSGAGDPPLLTGRGLRIQLALLPSSTTNYKSGKQSSIEAFLDVKLFGTEERAFIKLVKSSEKRSQQRLNSDVEFRAVNSLQPLTLSTIYVSHFNPGLQDLNPRITMESHLVVSTEDHRIQLEQCVLYDYVLRDENRYRQRRISPIRPLDPPRQGAWSVAMSGTSTRGTVNVLFFSFEDHDDREFGDALGKAILFLCNQQILSV